MPRRRLVEELGESDPQLARELVRVCEEASEIWKNQRLFEFTVHGGPHSLQVERNLDCLAENLQQGERRLTPEEIFVLIAACHLHDIGMQLGVVGAREHHAEHARQLILFSSAQIGPELRRVTLSIRDQNAREAIAMVARGHWTDFALRLTGEDFIYENTRGRLKLLGLLLATADLLDTSAIRASYFRSDHRLFDLNPVSELHQTMHHLICGYQIRPADSQVRDRLLFELEWRDCSEAVRQMSEWQLRWLSSQMRQLAPELERCSGGDIRWATPWARVVFRHPEGPMPQLSEAARCALQADLAAQRRIDREAFVDLFQKASATASSTMFILRQSPQSDARQLADWCQAQAQTEGECLFGRVDIVPGAPLELASLIADLMEQWKEHLPACEQAVAIAKLKEFVRRQPLRKLVLLAVVDGYGRDLLQPILETILRRVGDEGSRVCVAVCTEGQDPAPIDGVNVHRVDLSSLSSDDVGDYLKSRYGFDEEASSNLVTNMLHLGLLSTPGRVYTYVEDHCDR